MSKQKNLSRLNIIFIETNVLVLRREA
jgi:hypothetical protein